jgi:di/tripeptidase
MSRVHTVDELIRIQDMVKAAQLTAKLMCR